MGKVKGLVMDIEEELYDIDNFEDMISESESYSQFTMKLLEKPQFNKIHEQYGSSWVRGVLLDMWNEYWGTQYV
jgi:hypothetical protein